MTRARVISIVILSLAGAVGSAEAQVTEGVTWTNRVSVFAAGSGSSLQKPYGSAAWTAGASSTRAIVSGDGYTEFIHSADGYKMAGLSKGDSNASYEDIDFALYEAGSAAHVYESGAWIAGGWSLAEGDRLRVEVSGGRVLYKRNGALLYASTKTPAYPLLVDTSIYSSPTTINSVVISGALIDVAHWCGQGQPLTGDFDGNGRTDQLCYGPAGVTRVSLAIAQGFAPPTTWQSGWIFDNIVLGDFNGDGRTDIGDYKGDYFYVGLSTGAGFASPVSWGRSGTMYGDDGLGHACSGPSRLTVADFNGDGIADVGCLPYNERNIVVAISSGAAFSFSIWGNYRCDTSMTLGAADFNGDGKDDWYCIDSMYSQFTSSQSSGTSFIGGGYTMPGFCNIADYAVGDVNGDGKADLTCRGNGNVALSSGKVFIEQGGFGGWCADPGRLFTAELDGDGVAELVCATPAGDIQVRKYQAGALTAAETWKQGWCPPSAVVPGDFNGDGKTDLLCTALPDAVALAGTGNVRADLITAIVNGLGGTTQVTYTNSIDFPSANNPPPKFVVASLVVDDGRGQAGVTRYSYSGGLMDRRERQFMGFRYVKATLPCVDGETACPYTETYLKQDLASAGKPETVLARDGLGHALRQTTYEYTTNGSTVPRSSLLTGEWSFTFDEMGVTCATWPCASARRTYTTYQYDGYGNATQTAFSGDYDASGDETSTTRAFTPNASAYIVDRLGIEKHYGPGGILVKSQTFSYDGLNSWDVPPSKGSLTTSLDWLNTEARWVATTFGYDAFGNVITVTDPTGRATRIAYDGTHHLYPISATNGAGETESTTWDAACAVPVQQIDVAGQVTMSTADALCRVTGISGPLGSFEARSYVSVGDPHGQHVVVETPSATPEDGTGNDFRIDYLDGLGRVYRTVKKGPSPTQPIITDVVYDARGNAVEATVPYYANDLPQRTSFAYDALGRLTRATYADGNFVGKSYGVWSDVTQDEHGHLATIQLDAYGRAVVQERYLSGKPLQIRSTYDAMGQLVSMTDPAGNAWSWTFDWLGRNTRRSDPDSGVSTFEYDDAGRIAAQVDANAQRTTFTYDGAGRLATKVNAAGTVTFTRNEARTGYINGGQVTTIASPATVMKLDYDALGRPLRQTRTLDGVDYVAQRLYDAGGRIRGITYPDGDTIGTTSTPIAYDAVGRLVSIPGIVNEVLYDAAGRPLQQTNANGTVTTRTYSAERGWLKRILTTGTTTLQDLTYTLDPAGMATEVTSPFANEGWTYSYDDLHRLTSATSATATQSQAFEYDIVGNIKYNSRVGAYTYPSPGAARPHAPTAVAGNTFTYDAAGNLLSGNGRTITWGPDGLPTQINQTQLTYGDAGDRVKKVSPGGTSLYPFSDDYEVTNGTITKYISVGPLGLVAKRVGAATYWLHADRLGSIQVVTDFTGVDVQRRTYRPYGEKIADMSAHVESRGFVGERLDSESGLSYLHARYYDPALGMFISPDPIGTAGGVNQYAYGGSDPINLSDPEGLAAGDHDHERCPPDAAICFDFRYKTDPAPPPGGGGVLLPIMPILWWLIGSPGDGGSPPAPGGGDPAPGLHPPLLPIISPISFPLELPGFPETPTIPGGPATGGPGLGGPDQDPAPPVGPPGALESLVPIWGSGRSAINDFQTGQWGWGAFNTALAVSDAVAVKALATGFAKGAWKLGSHSWPATRAWYGASRGLARGTPVHHWLIEQASATGKNVPPMLKHQPYNLMPIADQARHIRVHQSIGVVRVWSGTPTWAKALWLSMTGRGVTSVGDPEP